VAGGDNLIPKKGADEKEFAKILEVAAAGAGSGGVVQQERERSRSLHPSPGPSRSPRAEGTVAERPENWPEVEREEELLSHVMWGTSSSVPPSDRFGAVNS
jgi:hypothetical protein